MPKTWYCRNRTRSILYCNVGIRELSALKIVFCEELGQLGLDAAQRLGLTMKQQHHVHHGKVLTHKSQQIAKETCVYKWFI